LAGALITIVMTGLDQDMMQKNLSCKTLVESQKNMFTYSIVIVFVNILFLSFGAMLYIYINQFGIDAPLKSDNLFPMLALQYLPAFVGIAFIIGLTAAAYSSADSALTALTTSLCVDFFKFNIDDDSDKSQLRLRRLIHVGFAILLGLCIILFQQITSDAVISSLFEAAGYTYGPLLGLFSFGIFTRLSVNPKAILPICLIAPVFSYLINTYSIELLNGFQFGFTIIALNGLITFIGLFIFSYRPKTAEDFFK
jgi:Na+/proline symporter